MKNQFSLGVAGAVVRQDKLLLVHHNYGDYKWVLPGGHVQLEELPVEAAIREIYEETKIEVEVHGLVSCRSRVDYRGNDTCFIFYMTPLSNQNPQPDGHEIDRAGYFTLEEIEVMEDLWEWPRWLARRILKNKHVLFLNQGDPEGQERKYQAFF